MKLIGLSIRLTIEGAFFGRKNMAKTAKEEVVTTASQR